MFDKPMLSVELRAVLSMILNALDRDAAEGKEARREMAQELRSMLGAPSAHPELGSDPVDHMAGLLALVVNPGSYPLDVLHNQIRATLEIIGKPVVDREAERLERLAISEDLYDRDQADAVVELRALLDKQSCGACSGCANGCKLDRESPPIEPAARHQGEAFTYSSKQATNCAGCGLRKHTPLRVDDMGGYVCLTCIDNRLGELLEDERHQGEPVCAQIRYRRPEKGCPDWGEWHNLKLSLFDKNRTHYIDSVGWECEARALYAEQPAPVAVVMPERLNPSELDELEVIEVLLSGQGLSNLAGTMAAARQFIDEVARLNGVKP